MCGGIGFNFKRISLQDLAEFYTPLEIAKFCETGRVESFFHQKNPVLPIEVEGQVKLRPWGNRDPKAPLPKTGWARAESLSAGKWNHLHPQEVKIVAEVGWEKGIPVEFEGGLLKGVAIREGDNEHIFMVTQEASQEYLEKTHHDREPVVIK